MTAKVYCITNLVNGKKYVGITRFNVKARLAQHVYKSKNNPKTLLHKAIAKYGSDNFIVEEIASCVGDWSEAERLVIQSINPAYNMTNGGEITVGKRVPREIVEIIIRKNTGKKRTPEQNKANSERRKLQMQDPVLRQKAIDSLRKAHARRSEFEPKRLEGIRRAALEGKMSRQMTDERKARQLANLNTKEAKEKMAVSKRKKVLCIDTGVVYNSLIEAGKKTGIDFTGISKVCLGKLKTIHKLRFKYLI